MIYFIILLSGDNMINKNISYEVYGSGKSIIYLHGWGMNKDSFKRVLNTNYKNYLIDLPGFGNSPLNKGYFLDDYVFKLKEFIDDLKIENPIIIGHSFGGRIAIKYSSMYDVKKLILVDSAGINLFSFKKMFNKIFKRGSVDYNNSSSYLRKTLVNVVNEDLRNNLKGISCETLIINGKKDKITPYKMARFLNKGIVNSGLVIIPKCGHIPFIERPKYYKLVVESFLSDEK